MPAISGIWDHDLDEDPTIPAVLRSSRRRKAQRPKQRETPSLDIELAVQILNLKPRRSKYPTMKWYESPKALIGYL